MVRLGVVVLVCLAGSSALAMNGVLVDKSGSLDPHYDAGKVEPIVNAALAVTGGSDLAMFGDEPPQPVRSFAAIAAKSPGFPLTRLDLAALYAINRPYDIAFIVTDNVQDEGIAGQGIERFYSCIGGSDVAAAVIFPIVMPPGSGLSGLVVYGLALKQKSVKALQDASKAFPGRLRGDYKTQAFWLKPLDENAIHPFYPSGRPPRFKRFVEGDMVKGAASIAFKSDLKHLDLSRATIECDKAGVAIDTADELLKFEKDDYRIEPVELRDLKSGETLAGYTLYFDLGRLKLKSGIGPFFEAALAVGTKSFKPRAHIKFRLPGNGVTFTPEFLRTYHAGTPSEASNTGKVFAIGGLPARLVQHEIAIDTALVVPIQAGVSPVPTFVLLLLLAAVAVGAYFIYRLIGRRPRKLWDVCALRLEDEAPVPCRVEETRDADVVKLDRDVYGEIKQRGEVFVAAQGWSLENSTSSWGLTLKHGATARMSRGVSGSVQLTFSLREKGPAKAASAQPRTTPRPAVKPAPPRPVTRR
jgi:hypothetical protein